MRAPILETTEVLPTPSLTLVVATVGRTSEVAELLCSIPHEVSAQVEVIVVDQNDEPLASVLLPFETRLRLVHCCLKVRNASLARNVGAQRAKAAWLMFPDDDARFERGALEHLLVAIRSDEVDLLSGRIVDKRGTPHLLDWPSRPIDITSDTLDRTLVESSFAIRKTLFHAVGGFDPKFGPGGQFPSAEGADLVRRLWYSRHLRARYTPAIALEHPAKGVEMSPASTARTYSFAVGEGAFTARHYRQLRVSTIARKLCFRLAGTLICRGERRRRKIAFLKGFGLGFAGYRKLHTL